jgi:hypothetical protein
MLAGCSVTPRNLVAPDSGPGTGGNATGSGGTDGSPATGTGGGTTGGSTGTCDPAVASGTGGAGGAPGPNGYHACTGGSVCLSNICLCQSPDQIFCGDSCVDSTTTQNCGGCGITCAAGQICARGRCSTADAGVTAGTAGASGSGGNSGVDAGGRAFCGGPNNWPLCIVFGGSPSRASACYNYETGCTVQPGGFGTTPGGVPCTCVINNGVNEALCPVGFQCYGPD